MAPGGSEGKEEPSEAAGTEGVIFLGLSSCQEMPVTTLNATFPVRDFAPPDPEGPVPPLPLSAGLYGALG